jgi:hypothetical protein
MPFLADAMLGKLAKWLRVMGYDCHYQSFYRPDVLEALLKEGRTLLTRHVRSFEQYRARAIFICSDHVAEQLHELKTTGVIAASGATDWFSRCLVCNRILEMVAAEKAREHIPEHVLFETTTEFRYCPGCRRFFWPGSHRQAMLRQLAAWGFENPRF